MSIRKKSFCVALLHLLIVAANSYPNIAPEPLLAPDAEAPELIIGLRAPETSNHLNIDMLGKDGATDLSVAPATAALPPLLMDTTPVSDGVSDARRITANTSSLSSTANSLAPTDFIGSANAPLASGGAAVASATLFKTQCTVVMEGKEDGTGLASAAINCTGPNVPVAIAGSNDLDTFAAGFVGVQYSHTTTTLGAVLQFDNVNDVALVNSQLVNTASGALLIGDSRMQVVGGIFSNNAGTVAGALIVQGDSSVLIDSTSFLNNTATAGGALVLNGGNVVIINSTFVSNTNSNSQGGAIVSDTANLSILGSSFVGNTATRGGAIYQSRGSILLTATWLIRNSAGTMGGSLFASATHMGVHNCTFLNGTARSWLSGTLGGAIATNVVNFTITESVFDGNRAQSQGGAVFQANSTGDVTSCTFTNNLASNGGGLFQDVGNGDIVLCLFENNTAAQTGGSLLQTNTVGNLRNSTFMGSRAGQLGGGVLQNRVASSLQYCIFQRNAAQDGGGIYRTAAAGNTLQSSFINNVAMQAGGAMYINNSKGNIKNTAFTGNKSPKGSSILLNASVPEVTGCLFDNSKIAGDALVANNISEDDTSALEPTNTGGIGSRQRRRV